MSEAPNIQQLLFEDIREKLDAKTSMVEEIADILSMSTDSAYRRIRNDTWLSFQEVVQLAQHFNLSIDKYVNPKVQAAAFFFRSLNEGSYNFIEYLKSIRSDLKTLSSSNNANIIYFAADIPLPQLLFVPEIAAFKLFFWEKTILNFEKLNKQPFEFTTGDVEVNNICREIRDLYISTPSTEIYSPETINTTLKQIRYYLDSGFFKDKNDAVVLCEKLKELVNVIRDQASDGFKSSKKNPKAIGEYKVYYNEVLYSDTSILAETETMKFSYLANNGLRRIVTHNEAFYAESKEAMTRLLKKATLISGSSEKERNMIFNTYHAAIDAFAASLTLG